MKPSIPGKVTKIQYLNGFSFCHNIILALFYKVLKIKLSGDLADVVSLLDTHSLAPE